MQKKKERLINNIKKVLMVLTNDIKSKEILGNKNRKKLADTVCNHRL